MLVAPSASKGVDTSETGRPCGCGDRQPGEEQRLGVAESGLA